LSHLEAITEVARTAVAALLAVAALSRGQVRPAELGQFAWLAGVDGGDRAGFFREVRDALAVAGGAPRAGPGEAWLRGGGRTARALSDRLAREILTGSGDEDYAEVSRPEE